MNSRVVKPSAPDPELQHERANRRRREELVAQTHAKVDFGFINRFNARHRREMADADSSRGRRLQGFNASDGDIMYAYYSPHYVGMEPVYW